MYKAEMLLKCNHNHNLCSKSELTVTSINTVFEGQNCVTVVILGQ